MQYEPDILPHQVPSASQKKKHSRPLSVLFSQEATFNKIFQNITEFV